MKKHIFKTLVFALILTLIFTTSGFALTFDDVEGEPYEEAVDMLTEIGAITGDTDGLYHPMDNLTRAQACAIIIRTINPSDAELYGTATQKVPDSGFTDMAGYTWAAPYINYAVAHDITNGVGQGKFAPGATVKTTELITFTLRAMGHTDKTLQGVWPDNYMAKAKALNLLKGLQADLPLYATKWMTAQAVFNGLDDILKAHEDSGKDSVVTKGLTYVAGSFNADITTFDGKPLSSKVKVFTYGSKSQYKSSMALPSSEGEYQLSTVYKYKNVATPAFYLMDGGKITQLILPSDVGFTGTVYGVVNDIVQVKNIKGDTVYALKTLAAGREITWLCEAGYNPTTDVATRIAGDVFKMVSKNGTIKSGIQIATSDPADTFTEYTTVMTPVFSRDGVVVRLTSASGSLYELKEGVVVYIFDGKDKYEAGKSSDIKKGKDVRLFHVSDEKMQIVEIAIVSD